MGMRKLITHAYNLVRHALRDVGTGATRSSHWPKVEHEHRALFPTCEACGSSVRIQVHHCLPFHIHPELELDPTNLISLCMSPKECHILVGHGDNFKEYNPNVRADAATVLADPSKFEQVVEQAKKNRLNQ